MIYVGTGEAVVSEFSFVQFCSVMWNNLFKIFDHLSCSVNVPTTTTARGELRLSVVDVLSVPCSQREKVGLDV